MANETRLAPHETLDLHELLDSGVTGAKIMQASLAMVKDPDLKSFMEDSLNAKKSRIQDMQRLISNQGMIQ